VADPKRARPRLGYPLLAASRRSRRTPIGARFYHRGISGNKVRTSAARWPPNRALAPDVLSILIVSTISGTS